MRTSYAISKIPSFTAFDTESYRNHLKVICTKDSHYEPDNDYMHTLDWVWSHAKRINFLFNLTYDRDILMHPVVASMSKEKRLYLSRKHRVSIGEYQFKLTGNKSFAINRSRNGFKYFYDIGAFFRDYDGGMLSLDDVAHNLLGMCKNAEELQIDRVAIGTKKGYYENHRNEIITYCKNDARLTESLATLLVQSLFKLLGFVPTRYNSKASISKAWLESNHPELMRDRKQRKNDRVIDEVFHNSYRGGIFTTPILGRVTNVASLDLTNAYGHALTLLPSLENATLKVSHEYHRDALLGSYECLVKYDGRSFAFDEGHGKIKYPVCGGVHTAWLTKPEVEYFIHSFSDYKIKVITAYEYFGEYKPALPDALNLINARLNENNSVKNMLLKTIINACYGCFAESRHGETPFTRWQYAAHVTGLCRVKVIKVSKLCENANCPVVSINTDGIKFKVNSNNLGLENFSKTKSLGQFHVEFTGATVTHYQSGIALIEYANGTDSIKRRGLPHLTKEDLLNAKGSLIVVQNTKVRKLLEVLRSTDNAIDELAVINKKHKKKIDLMSNQSGYDIQPEYLTFEYLNHHSIISSPPDYHNLRGSEPMNATCQVHTTA